MDNEQIKNFIKTQRNNGIPDQEIYSFLQEKGAIQTSTPQQQTQSGGFLEGKSGSTGFSGFAEGLGQSVLGAVQGAGTLIEQSLQKAFDPAISRITGVPQDQLKGGEVFTPGTEQFEKFKEMTTPETSAQKIGNVTGEIAQFAVPSTQLLKATKSARPVVKFLTQGLSDLGVASVQEGEVNDDALLAGLVGVGVPGIATGVKKIGQVLKTPELAGRVINSLVKPLKKDFAYGKNPGQAIAQEGIVANNLDDLGVKVSNVLDTRLKEYENIIKQSSGSFDVSNSFSPLQKAKDTAIKQNNQSLLNRIQQIEQALTSNLTTVVDDAGNQIIQPSGLKNLQSLSPDEILNLKRDLGDMTQFTGNASDDKIINKALKSIYGNIKQTLDDAVPGSSERSSRIADLLSAKSAIENRTAIAQRQNLVEFAPRVVQGAGLLASLATMNPVPALIGVGASGIEKALSTPAVKTRFASWLASATPAQKQELYKAMPELRSVINSLIVD